MMKTFILLFTLLIGGVSLAQGLAIEFRASIKDENTKRALGGVTIEVYKAGKLVMTETSNSGGKFNSIILPAGIGCTYTLKIKKEGFVMKTALVDAHSDYPEELPPGVTVQRFDADIFESVEGIDFSFLEREPMIEFKLDSYGYVVFDQKKIDVMKKKIEDLKKLMQTKKEELAKEEADFLAYIKAGDLAMSKAEYEKAIGQFELAVAIKKDDQPANDKLQNAKIKLEELRLEEARNKEFSDKMAAGKAAYAEGKLNEALRIYKEASDEKPKEQLPKDLIEEIKKKLADTEKNDKAFSELVAAGDAAVGTKDFDGGISKYEQALKLKVDAGVQTKLDNAKKLKVAKEKELADQKAEQAKFDDLIAKASAAFNAKDYENAKMNYQKAFDLKGDAGLKKKITEIDELIAANKDAANTKEKYEALIKEGDAFDKTFDYSKAIEKYEQAFLVKEDAYPKGKIADLKIKLAAKEQKEKSEKEYADLISAAKSLKDAEEYNKSLVKYKEAYFIRQDIEVKKEMDKLTALIAAQNEETAKKEKYTAKIVEADLAFKDKKWDLAKTLYNSAIDIKSDEKYPKDQLEIIKKTQAEDANKAANNAYRKVIDRADLLFKEDKLDEAIGVYSSAIPLMPEDEYPKIKIEEINKIKRERDNLSAEKKKEEERYKALVKDADALYNASNWDAARTKYNEALGVKSEEIHPKDRIKSIDERYLGLIKQADDLFTKMKYNEAKAKYTEALDVKPNEQYPKERINSADSLMKEGTENEEEAAYQKILKVAQEKFDAKDYTKALDLYLRAQKTKPSDLTPQQRIDEINQILSKKSSDEKNRKDFDVFLKEADYQFEKGNWKSAKASYLKAQALIDDGYVDSQIIRCDQNMQAISVTEVDENYNKIISTADNSFGKKEYVKAKDLYVRANGIKPSDQHPINRIAEIQALLNPSLTNPDIALTDYGKPNRSVKAKDLDAMMADAEAQRKEIARKKTEQQGLDASDTEFEQGVVQGDAAHETRGEVLALNENIIAFGAEAEEEIVRSGKSVELMGDGYYNVGKDALKGNENVVQLQNQVVNNINLEMDRSEFENDLPRVAYESNVDAIKSELILENDLEINAQRNDMFNQVDYVAEFQENRIEQNEAYDVDRKKTEMHVEDFSYLLVSNTNAAISEQENVVMNANKVSQESEIDREDRNLIRDIPRNEMELVAEELSMTLMNQEDRFSDAQYDVSVDQKNHAEYMMDDINIANFENDIPRQNMEDFADVQRGENNAVKDQLITEQNDVLFNSDVLIDEYKIERERNATRDDKAREGYEETVEDIIFEENEYVRNKGLSSEDNSHTSTDFVEDFNKGQRDASQTANVNADALIDGTKSSVEKMEDNQDNIGINNRIELEKSEDFAESLRDIKLNEIDEKMKNQLGSQFPEGVSEEIFTINDEDGLMVSYIIRRIVVAKGVGNVYEMVTSKFGTATYTCNGAAISEYQWQDQTTAANLVRN